MSRIYDNWEKLVAAVIKKQQLWELFHAQSRSPSMSSESSGFSFSFCVGSSVDDLNLSLSAFEELGLYQNEELVNREVSVEINGLSLEHGDISVKPSISVKDQSPVAPVISRELPIPVKKLSSRSFKKRDLVIQVPKTTIEHHVASACTTYNSRRSPNPSPRTESPASPLPTSRIRSGATTPVDWPDDAKKQSHPLPLPPKSVSTSSRRSQPNSAPTSPSIPRSPGGSGSPASPGSPWKKGKLIHSDMFGGNVYLGFNSDTGGMCAMKEVLLFSEDAKLKQRAKRLEHEIAVLSSLRHPNLVQYYGSEMVDDKLCLCFEYVSGGTVYNILKDYGRLGESAIRTYMKQVLSGLAYLHSRSTVHRNIKGESILIDPNGSVKLANFGIANHITGQFDLSSFEGSTYWMAPEVVMNSNVCNQAVDIWSLGCTVIEMATAKPPWSPHKRATAMFKIGYSKELPTIPDHLSDEGKDFVKLCLQRNPLNRPTAAQLLEHPFVKRAAPVEKQLQVSTSSDHLVVTHVRSVHQSDPGRLGLHSSRVSQSSIHPSDIYTPRYVSCPVSPVASPPHHLNGNITRSRSPAPLTSGVGKASLLYQFNQSLIPQEDFYNPPKHSAGLSSNSTSYWDPDILRGRHHSGYHASLEPASPSDNDAVRKQFVRTSNRESRSRRTALADRMSLGIL